MFNPNPWVKGFSPPSKCPNCKRLYTLTFTGKRNQLGDHIYHCSFCNKFIGAPTDYAECDFFDLKIEKDVFWSPCKDCPYRQPVPGRGVCKYFLRKGWYGETQISDVIERTIEKVYIPKWGKKGEEQDKEKIIINLKRKAMEK